MAVSRYPGWSFAVCISFLAQDLLRELAGDRN
jgi:hypothetical protein